MNLPDQIFTLMTSYQVQIREWPLDVIEEWDRQWANYNSNWKWRKDLDAWPLLDVTFSAMFLWQLRPDHE